MVETKLIDFTLTVNNETVSHSRLPAHLRLIDYLHEYLGLTGTKFGCGGGMCKACTVSMMDDLGVLHAVPACSVSIETSNNWSIHTVEGLAKGDQFHPMQEAFVEQEVFQCGYCTPGFLMEAYCLYENRISGFGRDVDVRPAVEGVLEAHLCRCTAYQRYVDAVAGVIELAEESTSVNVKQDVDKWQLVRWLHEAAEIENALMLQYLYAAFSIKLPRYAALAGQGHRTPGEPNSLLAVAIEEMLHLDTVNRLLVELGAAPNLVRQDFPYEPKIYPFQFNLEPLSKPTLAKYCLAEAPKTLCTDDPELFNELERTAGSGVRINDVGSFYGKIREELARYGKASGWVEWQKWDRELKHIQEEGETEHFDFFLSVYQSKHLAFFDVDDVWSDPNSDLYPAHKYPHKTMWSGHVNSLEPGPAKSLAKLSNLQYWLTMCLLDFSYRFDSQFHPLARRHMAGPLLQLCWYLPDKYQVMPPLDKSSMEFFAGLNIYEQVGYISSILAKIIAVERDNVHLLPPAYVQSSLETQVEFSAMTDALLKKGTS